MKNGLNKTVWLFFDTLQSIASPKTKIFGNRFHWQSVMPFFWGIEPDFFQSFFHRRVSFDFLKTLITIEIANPNARKKIKVDLKTSMGQTLLFTPSGNGIFCGTNLMYTELKSETIFFSLAKLGALRMDCMWNSSRSV